MNRTVLNDFYDVVEELLTKLDLKDKPVCIWNCDETGLSYGIKYCKTVCQIGRKNDERSNLMHQFIYYYK